MLDFSLKRNKTKHLCMLQNKSVKPAEELSILSLIYKIEEEGSKLEKVEWFINDSNLLKMDFKQFRREKIS